MPWPLAAGSVTVTIKDITKVTEQDAATHGIVTEFSGLAGAVFEVYTAYSPLPFPPVFPGGPYGTGPTQGLQGNYLYSYPPFPPRPAGWLEPDAHGQFFSSNPAFVPLKVGDPGFVPAFTWAQTVVLNNYNLLKQWADTANVLAAALAAYFNEQESSAVRTVLFNVTHTNGVQSSTTPIPPGALILYVAVVVTVAFSGGTTIKVGVQGSTSLLIPTSSVTATTPGTYLGTVPNTGWPPTALPVEATVAGSPSVGAAYVLVQYTLPDP